MALLRLPHTRSRLSPRIAGREARAPPAGVLAALIEANHDGSHRHNPDICLGRPHASDGAGDDRDGMGDAMTCWAQFDHVWFWRSRLPERKGERCRVLARGRMNSILVEFTDGYRTITSRYAVRRAG